MIYYSISIEGVFSMFTARTTTGRNNHIGIAIRKRRQELHISQRELSDRLVSIGLNIDKNAVQRIESGQRFLTDVELPYFAKLFDTTIAELYEDSDDE